MTALAALAAIALLLAVRYGEDLLVGVFVVLPLLVLCAPFAVWTRVRTGRWPS